MKKIFVTGVPGWLGNRFVDLVASRTLEAQKEPYDLKCFMLKDASVANFSNIRMEILRGDVSDAESLRNAMQGCDYVVHMVGIIHPKRVSDFYEINTQGTQNILDEAIRAGVKRIVFISSNAPAGFSKPGALFTEQDLPQPYMNYGRSKYQAEQIILNAVKERKIEGVVLRPCWYYGPGQPARQTKFFKMIQNGNPILFGDGSNLRSVSYVDSVVQAILLALQVEQANGEIFWIADEKPYSSIEIYQTIANLLGVKKLCPRKIPGVSSWFFEQLDRMIQATGNYQQEIHVAGEMARNIACNVEKAKRILGYKPLVSLEEGMRRSIEWCKKNGINF